jgi:cytochrome c biogenesis protein CcdA
MQALDLAQVSLFSVLVLGISVGFTACTASCLPYMGSWVLSRAGSWRSNLLDTSLFALGKLLAYAVLGGTAAILGTWLLHYLQSGIGHLLIGLASIVAGIWLIRNRQTQRRCGLSRRQHLHPLLLGFSLSFIPCAPLAALLTACAAAGSFEQGIAYGFMFGLGAALTPLFIILPLLGRFAQQLRVTQPWLERWLVIFGGSVLVVMGLYRISLMV